MSKYFSTWATVVIPTAAKYGGKIAYIDLYAGPGRYKDGAQSTPLLVLQTAIKHPQMSKMLTTYFNDANGDKASALQTEIDGLPGIEKLRYKPIVTHKEITDDDAAAYFDETRLVPSFSFIDPFGYKGLSLKLLQGAIKDWGCDCVFFFNYNRINAGINNPSVKPHMDALFGEKGTDALRVRLPELSPELREAVILEELTNEIKSLGGKYVLPFTFKNSEGTRTSHKLIFVSKHFKGYEIMKDVMAAESSTSDEGVPSLAFSPADESTPLLFSLAQPLSKLKEMLLSDFSGKTCNLKEIYEQHSVDRQYTEKNYRKALSDLEEEGKIKVYSTRSTRRRKGAFPDYVKIQLNGEC